MDIFVLIKGIYQHIENNTVNYATFSKRKTAFKINIILLFIKMITLSKMIVLLLKILLPVLMLPEKPHC